LDCNSLVERRAAIRDSNLEGSVAGRRARVSAIYVRSNFGAESEIGS
jgi:hypothetical protein